jgi:acetoin utilization deacetylase AcuC-like enzyme
MRAFFHPDQQFHDPQQFMRAGRIAAPKDLPARSAALIAGLQAMGIAVEAPGDSGLAPLEAVHQRDYLDFLATAYAQWASLADAGPEVLPNTFPYWNARPEDGPRPACPSPHIIAQAGYYLGDLAVPIGPRTWPSIRASASSAVAAADAVLAGEDAAYALCRPSGHHARADRASGFCYVNNCAVAAQRLRSRFPRVAIIDVDAHHGDGTQTIFYRRDDVFTASVHADPTAYYPFFTGYAHECGVGAGTGRNLNLPLPPGAGDAEIAAATQTAARAAMDFGAEALVVALGFDGHAEDPIGILKVSTGGFRAVGEALGALGLPTVIVQEGGYQIPVLADCLREFLTDFA